MKKIVSIALLVASLLTIHGGLSVISAVIESREIVYALEGLYYYLSYIWVFWLFLVIPVGSLIFGIRKGVKKNIVVGTVMSVLLLLFGGFFLMRPLFYSTDMAIVAEYETKLKIELPEEGSVIALGFPEEVEDGFHARNAVVRFTDAGQIEDAFSNPDPKKWTSDQSAVFKKFPSYVTAESAECEYFLLYCPATDTYFETSSATEDSYIFLAWDADASVLYISEFTLIPAV